MKKTMKFNNNSKGYDRNCTFVISNVCYHLESHLENQVLSQIRTQVRNRTLDQIWEQVGFSIWDALLKETL